MDPLLQLSPQSLAGIMQQLQMRQLTQQAQNNPQNQTTVMQPVQGLWGGF